MPSTQDVITASLSSYNARDLEVFLASSIRMSRCTTCARERDLGEQR